MIFSFLLKQKNNEASKAGWNIKDAGIFHSISIWNNEKGKQLKDVLLAGDLLTSKIFTIDELKSSLPKLMDAGLIQIKDEFFFLTAEGKNIFDRITELSNRVKNQIHLIELELAAICLNSDILTNHLDFLTNEYWEKAVDECSAEANKIFN